MRVRVRGCGQAAKGSGGLECARGRMGRGRKRIWPAGWKMQNAGQGVCWIGLDWDWIGIGMGMGIEVEVEVEARGEQVAVAAGEGEGAGGDWGDGD